MRPETQAYLDKAGECLARAKAGLAAAAIAPALAENAARDAYLTAFHAAKAVIFERTGVAAKTHGGVHAEFNRLARGEVLIHRSQRAFLKKAFAFKAAVDYETTGHLRITLDVARAAITDAEQLMMAIAASVAQSTSGP